MTDIESLSLAALELFQSLGGERVDPPTIMDATIPLDLSGEAVRSRLCVFTDARGREIALRPDLTLPVALGEARDRMNGASGERILHYAARAFRLPVEEGFDTEFTQVGFERFGAPPTVETDVALASTVLEAANLVGQARLDVIRLGDLAVFPAIVDAVIDDQGTAESLKRQFRQSGVLRMAETGREPSGGARVSQLLAKTDRASAEALVGEMLDMAGIAPVGARGIDEIVERLMVRSANDGAIALSPASRALLQETLSLAGPARETVETLVKTVKAAKLPGLDPVFERLIALVDALDKIDDSPDQHFSVSFGRRFTYYDGFLFEVFAKGAHPLAPLAAGGRYDRLIRDLSDGAVEVTAIGGVVRPDRMAMAMDRQLGGVS